MWRDLDPLTLTRMRESHLKWLLHILTHILGIYKNGTNRDADVENRLDLWTQERRQWDGLRD